MAIDKSQKPANLVPRSFGGEKNNFSDDLIANGYEVNTPQTYNGDNLNYQLDATGKELDYCEKVVDYINGLGVGKTPIVNANNKLDETQVGLKVYSPTETYSLGEWVRSGDKIYQSLTQGNLGNDLTNETCWKEVSLGSSGLELCDIGMALYVDETKGLRRYLNGQIVDINANTQSFLDRLKNITTLYPSLLCTEEEWQTAKIMSAFGQVGKFVFNYADDGVTVVSVRIPRVVNIQGVFDLQNLGLRVDESLPNIEGTFGVSKDNVSGGASGCFSEITSSYSRPSGTDYTTTRSYITLDASLSSSTYQDNAPVQQEAIQYPYFIQIATGQETENNIINDIELNNPYSLFDSKYSDHELNNLSWLKSNGQWNAKAIYTDAYDKLLKVQNGTETVEGLSVKLSTETYTDYDFVLNTADETFRLPLLDGSEDLLSDRYDDLELLASGSTYTAPANGWFFLRKFTSASNQFIGLYQINNNGVSSEITNSLANFDSSIFIPVRKGQVVSCYYSFGGETKEFRFIYAKGNGSLYYYVGETVQNANLIDAGRIGETLVGKADVDLNNLSSIGVEKFDGEWTGATGGWIELWNATISTSLITIDLSNILPNDDYDYEIILEINSQGSSSGGSNHVIIGKDNIQYGHITPKSSGAKSPIILPITGKNFTAYKWSGQNISLQIGLRGYRRLGKTN